MKCCKGARPTVCQAVKTLLEPSGRTCSARLLQPALQRQITIRLRQLRQSCACLLLQFVRQPVQIEPSSVVRETVKASSDLLHVSPAFLIGMQISVTVHVAARRIAARREVAEEHVDGDAHAVRRRRRVRPQRRNEQDVAWFE